MTTRNETFNGTRNFQMPGRFLALLNVQNPVDVTVYGPGDVVLERELAVETGYFVDHRDEKRFPHPFQRIEITTGANEAVKFLVTSGGAGSYSLAANITDRAARLLGIVASITAAVQTYPKLSAAGALVGEDAVVDAGNAFAGQYLNPAPGVGLFAYVHLFNPVASGKTIFVDEVFCERGTAGIATIAYTNATAGAAAGTYANKKNGGAAGSATILQGSNAAALGTVIDRIENAVTNNPRGGVKPKHPFELPAGFGLLVQTLTANEAIWAGFHTREY